MRLSFSSKTMPARQKLFSPPKPAHLKSSFRQRRLERNVRSCRSRRTTRTKSVPGKACGSGHGTIRICNRPFSQWWRGDFQRGDAYDRVGAPIKAVRFRLDYSVDNRRTWHLIGKNVTGSSFDWHVPAPLGIGLRPSSESSGTTHRDAE